MRAPRTLLLCLVVMAMTACGGGGDAPQPADGKVPPPAPVNCVINPALCR